MQELNAAKFNRYKMQPERNEGCKENKPKYPSLTKNLILYIDEFCQNTSLHGLKFLGERRRSVIEKLWWLVIITVALYFCSDLIWRTYQKWDKSPVIVNFATTQTPIWQIPFPAVTICPETKSLRLKYNYTEIYLKRMNSQLTPVEEELYEYMSLVCTNKKNVTYKYVDDKMLDFVTEVAPRLEDVLWNCKWMETGELCDELFVPIITDVGVCYSFNILDRSDIFADDVYQHKDFHKSNKAVDWSPDDGYLETDDSASYPQRALFSGAKAGISLNLALKKIDKDDMCSAGMQGYKVHLHHPANIPRIDEDYFRVSLDEVVMVAAKPNVMNTNEKLYTYPYQKRQCYFPEEKPLRYFKLYSQQNCHVECLTNFTFRNCNCVAFHMPRLNSTKICGPAKTTCVTLAETMFLAEEVNVNMKKLAGSILTKKSYETCECLPSCTDTSYQGEISQTPWNWARYYDSAEFRDRITQRPRHNSKLIVYFKDKQIMTSERNELYGATDFIANCGGLLGLFIGFSVISLMELLYYLTLRLFCNLRKFGKHFWSGNEELLNQNN